MIVYLLHIALLPPLVIGFIRKIKAQLQNRVGPPLLQPYFDVAKLLGKRETVSDTTTWVFRAAPPLSLAALMAAALMTPWLGMPSPLAGDLFLVMYLLALAKFAGSLAALDAGSAFGALGASREATVSLLSEPTMLLALAALGANAHSSSLDQILLASGRPGLLNLLPLVVIALWLAAMAEMARMPIDDPTTHLELTMIHEALILENSGPNLALVELSVGLKLTMLLGLIAQVVLLSLPPQPTLLCYGLTVGLIAAGAMLIAVAESTLVKLRWRRLPNLLSFGMVAAILACLLAVLE